MSRQFQRLAYQRHVAAHYQRRRALALLVERLETITRCPARNQEQAELKRLAVERLVEGADLP